MKFINIILLISIPILGKTQNSTKVFENITIQIVKEEKVRQLLKTVKENKDLYYVLLIDSLYEVDRKVEINLEENSTLYIYPIDELFFIINKNWLVYEKFELYRSKLIVDFKIIHSFDNKTSVLLKAKYVFKKMKNNEWQLKIQKYKK